MNGTWEDWEQHKVQPLSLSLSSSHPIERASSVWASIPLSFPGTWRGETLGTRLHKVSAQLFPVLPGWYHDLILFTSSQCSYEVICQIACVLYPVVTSLQQQSCHNHVNLQTSKSQKMKLNVHNDNEMIGTKKVLKLHKGILNIFIILFFLFHSFVFCFFSRNGPSLTPIKILPISCPYVSLDYQHPK